MYACIPHIYLLTMASKSFTGIIIILTIGKQNLMPPAQGTAHGKREPDIPLISSTPNPTPPLHLLFRTM